MLEITLITGNQGKATELSSLLGVGLKTRKAELTEIQALDVELVAYRKAAEAYAQLGVPVLVDDTGFTVSAWNGLPGALVAWFLQSIGDAGILEMAKSLEDRSASVTTALGYADSRGVKVFTGSLFGSLSFSERGASGFGYDPIFIPNGYHETFAEMSSVLKNEISMRRLAADKLRAYLAE